MTNHVARYPVPGAQHRVEQTIERSRFICTVARAPTPEVAQAFLREVSTDFSDATHNCWAYVAGPPASTGRVGMSDDGEPHGTAGRPMLLMLLHSGVGEIAAVATRYYGGVKLGTGGLARAYSGSVQLALESMPRDVRVELVDVRVVVGYASISGVQQLFPAFEANVVAEEYGTEVRYRLSLPKERLPALTSALLDATSGRAEVSVVS